MLKVIDSVKEFSNRWFCDRVTVKDGWTNRRDITGTVMWLLGTKTKVRIFLSVKRAFTTVYQI